MRSIIVLFLFFVLSCTAPENNVYQHYLNDKPTEPSESLIINDSQKYMEVVLESQINRKLKDTLQMKPGQQIKLGGAMMYLIIDQWEIEPFDEGVII